MNQLNKTLLASLTALFVLIVFSVPNALAQQNGTLTGTITDENNQPIPGINVGIVGTTLGDATGPDGKFLIEQIPANDYQISVSAIGFEKVRRSVTIKGNETLELNITLQKNTLGLSEIVVSANRSLERLSTVPASISVLDTRELSQQTTVTSDLGDVLAQNVPGLAPSTGTLSNYGQTLRGRNLFILIDGVPQSTPLRNGLRALRSINPSAIERIEVVRGASALYGYGATGGAINIITKQPSAGNFNIGAEVGTRFSGGNFDDSMSERFQLDINGTSGRFDYIVSGSFEDWGYFFDGEGDRVPQDPQGQGGLAGADEYNALVKLGAQLNDQQRLEGSFNYYDFKQDLQFVTVPGVVGSSKATAEKAESIPGKDPGTENLVTTLRYEHNNLLGSHLSAQAFLQDYKTRFGFNSFFPDGGGQGFISSEKQGLRLDIESPLAIKQGSALLWGVDLLRDETAQPLEDGRTYVPPIKQTSAAPFAQLKVPFAERAVLRGGVRYETFNLEVDDYTTLFGQNPVEGGSLNYDAFLFNAGGVLFLSETAEVFASFSQGFSVADVGRVLRSFGEGSDEPQQTSVEALRPKAQKVNSYEVGARFSNVLADASVTGFINTSDLGTSFTGNFPDLRIAVHRSASAE